MACRCKLVTKDGQEFDLGKYNEGKRTDTQVALAAARKYKGLIKRLECGGYKIVVSRDGSPQEVPTEAFRGQL